MKKKVMFEDVCRAQNHIATALVLLRGVAAADGDRGQQVDFELLEPLSELNGPSLESYSLSDWAVALEEELAQESHDDHSETPQAG